MANGFSLYKIFIGAGVSATLGILTFMGNGIVGNERRNVDQHREIRKESIASVNDVKNLVTDVRIEQSEQRIILRGIANKL